jgi:hypothetical protein
MAQRPAWVGAGLINTDQNAFNMMTAAQGFGLPANRITKLGEEYFAFCSIPQ